MNVIYGINAKLGGGGIGYTAFNATVGIYRDGWLTRVFASSNAQRTIPATLVRDWGMFGKGIKFVGARDASGLIYYLDAVLFDLWVTAQMPFATVLHSWNGMCLRALYRAKQNGMITIVERASAHPATQIHLLREEYARWNVPLRIPRWNYRRLLDEIRDADYITIPSAFVRSSMLAEGVPENKLIEIPFGVDTDRFCPPAARGAHPFRAIFAGQVSVRKGVPDLLDAWQRLQMRNAELWIVGGMSPECRVLCARWTHERGVRFIPHSSDLPRLFQQCDVFVFPTIEEGSALVTYEALASGLPVLTTPNAGSIVRDNQDGFIIPIRDVDALCDRLVRLHVDATLRTQMSRSARARAEEFPWSRYQAELGAQYRRIAGE